MCKHKSTNNWIEGVIVVGVNVLTFSQDNTIEPPTWYLHPHPGLAHLSPGVSSIDPDFEQNDARFLQVENSHDCHANSTDPTINFGLLGLLSGKYDKYLIQEFGVDYIDELKALA